MSLKTFLKKALFPHILTILFLVVFSSVGLTVVFVKGLQESVIAYIIYCVSFYTLCTVCLFCFKKLPAHYRSIKKKLKRNKYIHRYFNDTVFKTKVNLYRSLVANLIYASVNAISAYVYNTAWFAIFAVYYAIMAMMRFLLVRYVGRRELGQDLVSEWKRSRICAGLLMMINLALMGAVLMMLYFGRGFSYRGMLIYVMATYTFYITVTSVVGLVRFRKQDSPVIATSRVVKLTSALVSMLFLETAMFSQFGGDTPKNFNRL